MANAVEEACVIIICFSEKYKDSPSCRTEAEYTYKLRKPIIPLKMQTGYDPNGWLGAILGTKLYIQMNTLDLVQQNMGNLVRELDGRGRTMTDDGDDDDEDVYIPARGRHVIIPDSPRKASITSTGSFGSRVDRTERYGTQPEPTGRTQVVTPVYSTGPVPTNGAATCLKIMQQWDARDVGNWLRRNNYSHLQDWFLGYTGEDVVGLKTIAAQAPEFFFGKLERDLGFKSLLEMIRFKKMLDNIY